SAGSAAARRLGWHAHQSCVLWVVWLDGDLDDVLVVAPTIFLNVHSGKKLQAVQVMEALNATGRCSFWTVVLRVDIACGVQCGADETAPHLTPSWSFGRVQ